VDMPAEGRAVPAPAALDSRCAPDHMPTGTVREIDWDRAAGAPGDDPEGRRRDRIPSAKTERANWQRRSLPTGYRRADAPDDGQRPQELAGPRRPARRAGRSRRDAGYSQLATMVPADWQ